MPTYKISQLPAVTSIAGTEELEVNQAGTSRKATRTQLVAGLVSAGAVTGSGLTMSTARVLGRSTAGTGAIEEISIGSGLTLSGATLSASGGSSLTGQTGTLFTFLGVQTGVSSPPSGNVGVGYQTANSLGALSTENTVVGIQALQGAGFSMASNTAIGYQALQVNTASLNTAIGAYSLHDVTTGSANTAVGTTAGDKITTGSNNICIGRDAGSSGTNDLTTGSNNIIIGHTAAATAATVSNEITLGNSSISALRCQVTTITALSDARDKTGISDLPAGLTFVNRLRPVAFDWAMRDGGKVGVPDTGFIAQDLQAVQQATGVEIPGLVYDSNPDRLEAGYGKLIPVLVKAIQELAAEVEALKSQLIKGY